MVHLPLIDLSSPRSPAEEEQQCSELLRAASEWGFLYIRFNSGLRAMSSEDVERTFEISRKFFASPFAEKELVRIGPADTGWSAPFNETLDSENREKSDNKEAFNLGEFKDGQPQQELPRSLQSHVSDLDRFANLARGLCLKLLEMFAVALRIPKSEGGREWFSSRHVQANGRTGSILRLLYYPAASKNSERSTEDDDQIRCGAHTDFGGMTLLLQRPGQPGLEIEKPDHSWMPVEVSPPGTEEDEMPPIVINIGDQLSYWTNGYLRSTKHRVVIPGSQEKDRYSIAYFCHPARETKLVPVPSPLIPAPAGREDASKSITAAEHLKKKLAEAYGWKD